MSAQKLFEAGYQDLVCVIPPDGKLSPNSRIQEDQRGKSPGVRYGGSWGGYGWLKHETTAEDAERWDRWGANIGVKSARFPGIDIDVNDEPLANFVAGLALKTLGAAPIRLSRKPRLLLVYRTDEPFGKMRLVIKKDGAEHAVEVLANGQQYLVHGKHPKGTDYRWGGNALWERPPEDLTPISKEAATAFLADLAERLRTLGYECELAGSSSTGEAPAQDGLRAPSAEALRALVTQIPNPENWGWDDMVKMGCAIKAASAEFEDAGLDAFIDWCGRWEREEPDDDAAITNWESFKAPFRLGFSWLQEQADKFGYCSAQDEFAADPNAVAHTNPETSSSSVGEGFNKAGNVRLEALLALNERYAVVQLGGDVMILQEQEDGSTVYLGRDPFGLKLGNRFVPDVQQPFKTEPLAKAWLAWPERREYDAVVFKPGVAQTPNEYNLWKGWEVEPSETGSCDLFLKHLLDVVCSGNREHCKWILDWMGHIFQFPMEKPGTVLGLQGSQGAGKSIVGAVLGGLLGRYQIVAEKNDQVVGRFNEHLAHCLLLQAEEAFWGGSKQAAGTLKHLVTGTHMLVERKGIDAVQMRNYTRLLITSNEDQVWPAAIDDRRLAIFRVTDARRGDLDYFDALMDQMDNGGYGRLLHLLLNRKIDRHSIKRPPTTKALEGQVAEALPPHEDWLLTLLTTGEVPGRHMRGSQRVRTTVAELYDGYRAGLGKEGYAKKERAFSMFLTDALGADATGERERVETKLRSVVRSSVIVLPPLGVLRKRYSLRGRGARQIWPDPQDWTVMDAFGEPVQQSTEVHELLKPLVQR